VIYTSNEIFEITISLMELGEEKEMQNKVLVDKPLEKWPFRR
jgi:hypothetical protein